MTASREAVIGAFRARFGSRPELIARAPGRVNLLGAHVDYNDGWVLPCAIDRGIWLAARPNGTDRLRVELRDFRQSVSLALVELDPTRPPSNSHAGYPAGVAWALQQAGYAPAGLDAVVAGDLPLGAGVSSSAALEMAFLLAWEYTGRFHLTDLVRAQIGMRAENGFLGVGSGIMDQYASVAGRQDHFILLDVRTLSTELIPAPEGLAILLADSGLRRRLAASNYNDRGTECAQAVQLLKPHLPHIQALRDVTPAMLAEHAERLPPVLRRRARHVVAECRRVLEGAEALRRRDLETFGALVAASHRSSRDLYDSSTPELDLLAETAWEHPGVYGARFVGAGYGGCVAALVRDTESASLAALLGERYQKVFGRPLTTYSCQIADGAAVEPLFSL